MPITISGHQHFTPPLPELAIMILLFPSQENFLDEIRYFLTFSRASVQMGPEGQQCSIGKGGSALCQGRKADQWTGGSGAFCPSLPQLMTLCRVISRGTEDGRKTTASQLGWTQEFDLPGARHITVVFGQAAFLKWLYDKALLTGHPF